MRPSAILLTAMAFFCTLNVEAKQTAEPGETKPAASLASRTASMQHMPGLLALDWDAKSGKLYLEVPLAANAAHTRSADLLYTDSLPFGTGSNDLGLDRGQTAEGRIVHFERTGPKLLLVEPNAAFRTSSNDPAEQLAVAQSFPESVLGGFKVEAESADGTVLVDATDFFLRDVHHVTEAVARAKQGSYHVDVARSTIALDRTKAFPKNTEVEAELTFATDDAAHANFVNDVTPDPRAMTVREHQSFLELPRPGFTPRRFSPRAGYFPSSYRELNAPLGEPLDQNFILRHRLIKRDPNCTRACVAVAPIQYYVDRGAPEPIRSALVEGARWWDQAFQAAGWAPGTFRVDLLPEGADPMDVRYNIIQWVHRYTRGWSYGAAIADPRTGEIIKGNVTLGSLRARQDFLIAEALLSPYANGNTHSDAALQMVLERIRQLAAHETGHTLGLAHNFAASSFPHPPTQTVSVMDYPAPYVTLKDGVPNLSEAYPAGIGLWDKVAIDYGYREFDHNGKPVEDAAALDRILRESEKTGLIYITDEDARPLGSAHPHAHLWDNGTDPAAELDRVLEIRSAALARFGEKAIEPGTDLAQLEDTLVPLYLFHRYQTEAAAKEIGGLDYRYNVRGDGQPMPMVVSNGQQKEAIAAVLKTLSPEVLTLPESLLAILPPRPPGLPRTREDLPAETGLTFDPVASAEAAADMTLQLLLAPERAARIVQYHMRTPPSSTSLRVLMEAISAATARRIEGGHTMSSEVERAVEFRALEAMLALAVNEKASSQVRAITRWHINDLLKQWTAEAPPSDSAEAIHRAAMIERIQEFERAPEKFVPVKLIEAPPGMPIGDNEW
ncbi:MAG TPA: zinc-dependent metalloprotease [Acidobacteriaceae bacterium]